MVRAEDNGLRRAGDALPCHVECDGAAGAFGECVVIVLDGEGFESFAKGNDCDD